jgi:chemotaxis protein MotB
MSKFDTDDEIGKPGKPPKLRRFPWRLWLWALVMTATAGAGGYFTWFYREDAIKAKDASAQCFKERADLQKLTGGHEKEATDCKATLAKQTGDLKTSLDAALQNAKALETQNNQLSTNLNASKEELAQLRQQKAEALKRMEAIEDIQRQFAKMTDTGQLKVTARRGSLVIQLPAEVLFPSGIADLSEDGKLKVLEVGFTLKKFTDRRFLVIGHSDNQPLKGSVYKDNWELSAARALNVTRMLVQAGMDSRNLLPAGAGEHDPLLANNAPQNMARNRRIEIHLLPAINELPPLPASLTDDKKK